MKIRSTILALAGFATISLSALAPTQASAFDLNGGDIRIGGIHISGLNVGNLAQIGGGYRVPTVTYQRPCPGEAHSYAPAPQTYAPATYAQAPQNYAPAPQGYAPASQYAPAPQGYAPAEQGSAPAPQEYAPAPQSYAPAPQAYAPQQQPQGNEAAMGSEYPQQPSQDRNRVNYSSRELQK
jgi:hypothetical protein